MQNPFITAGAVSLTFPALVISPTGDRNVAQETSGRLPPAYPVEAKSVRLPPPKLGASIIARNQMAQATGQAQRNFSGSPVSKTATNAAKKEGGCGR